MPVSQFMVAPWRKTEVRETSACATHLGLLLQPGGASRGGAGGREGTEWRGEGNLGDTQSS